ncbi:DUF6681 family protein [Ligilactobacillus acidipiscis]|uniref:7TM-DISM domain-containing protein n=1 Tax=Ligilactobacillus acidipiscis TaxID=89059 RepID=A0A1K1KQT5_9LACO|nr:DUF6681 family protein [Ligilactobacillus acidipiscis]SFV41251.1 hypothetical protein LAC1533_1828 [Ligilactobacillus acidipiscis]HJE97966.1 7TM-DISM domain-containing protein [Ligilactobacillus acidipiscis]
MFALFQTIAASLGYVNLSATIKSRVYTILATGGNFYLLYVSYRFFRNGFPGRGSLFILAFLVIAYFCYLNIMYYFTDKQAKYDLSPKVEEVLHIESKDPLSEEEQALAHAGLGYIQTNGIFSEDEDFLPATLNISDTQKQNIQEVEQALQDIGFVHANYAGLTDKQIAKRVQDSGKEVHKLVEPVALPYFEMVKKQKKLVIRGGVNQMRSAELATVKTIGLLPASEAVKKFDVYLATAALTGGPAKKATRQGAEEFERLYQIDVKFAYKKKDAPAPKLNPVKEKELQSAEVVQGPEKSPNAANEKQAVVENETGSKTSETPTGVDHHLSRKERYDR